jgi:SAM-dependent methyltransferase
VGDELSIDRDRRGLFGGDPSAYDLGRPGYPERVYHLLRERCGLAAGTRVLEIGPGTGQATRRLLELGASVTGVELSGDLADRLRENHHGQDLEVVVDPFEDARLPGGSFDIVAAATCFHWIPTGVGLRRCARVLRDRGSVALWWAVFGDPGRPDPFRDAVTRVLRRLAPEVLDVPATGGGDDPPPYALDVAARLSEIARCGHFAPAHHETISWTGRHSARQIRALFASYSPWLALPPETRARALDALEQVATDDFGGIVERPYLTPVYIAAKHPEPGPSMRSRLPG